MSLRIRLLLGAIVAISVALAISWGGLSLLFDRHVERRLRDDLVRQGLQLAGSVTLSQQGRPVVANPPADPRFVAPASGLYWQVSTTAGRERSRSLWDQALAAPSSSSRDWDTHYGGGPFGQRVLLVERIVRFEGDRRPIAIQVAVDLATLRSAREDFGRELALSLALLGAVLAGAAWIQVSLGLRPLKTVREGIGALRSDPSARLTEAYPTEIQPLTEAINALASAREVDLTRARRRAADLAHGLKTPLAAIAALSRRARHDGAGNAADGLDRAIAAASTAINAELGRARAEMARDAGTRWVGARGVVERVVNVVEHTGAGARLLFDIEIGVDDALPLDEADLTELLGAIVENASRFARRRVLVAVKPEAGGTMLSVDDDGPGIAAPRRAESVLRGGRLDEGGGHGLGLAIARDLVEATGGALTLNDSPLGGLSVRMRWPDAV